MKETENLSGQNPKRLQIDKKVAGILSVSALLGICLVITIIVATNSLTGLLGFSTMQTHWTEARKEASQHLISYLRSQDQSHFASFKSARAVIDSAHAIRTELAEERSDYNVIRSKFPDLHISSRNIDKMNRVFERFHDFSEFERSISLWADSDTLVFEMASLANEARNKIANGTFTENVKRQMVQRVNSLDNELTSKEYKITKALSDGTANLNTLILVISISLGVILVVTGGFITFRFLKSIKKWHRALEIREQEYRSLFEENPNAVYSFNTNGEFRQGNEALEQISGYPIEELRGKNFEKFIVSQDVGKVISYFRKALDGLPQTYETAAIKKNGEKLYLEITNLPIMVDNEINGVYGIAHDITDRKEKNRKIEKQLSEKTLLLSEMHDRVKNNLALISGLISLQRDKLQEQEDMEYLDNLASRIHTIAMVHEQIYKTEDFSNLRIDKYIGEFTEKLDELLNRENVQNNIDLNLNPVSLNISQAVPAALLLNELVTNACKYGASTEGDIKIKVDEEGSRVSFTIKDSGPGLPKEHDIEDPQSLGLRLVRVLINQLDAGYELYRNGGTTFVIRFKKRQNDNSLSNQQ